jgi:hypothetical protein
MSDTPRTDAINTYIRTRNDYTKTDHEVWREHARTLETELAAAKKRIADCEFVMAHRYDIIERQEPRCNEANARAEKAEAELVQLRAENDEMRVQIEANKRKGGGCQCADDEACAHVRRAEKAEASLHNVSLDLLTANHMIKLERDRADALQTRLNEIDAMLKSPDLID